MNNDSFEVDSSLLHLTFVTFFLLSFTNNSNYVANSHYVYKLELLTRFWTNFTSKMLNFCCVGTVASPAVFTGNILLMYNIIYRLQVQ